jgi:hypothetical protein
VSREAFLSRVSLDILMRGNAVRKFASFLLLQKRLVAKLTLLIVIEAAAVFMFLCGTISPDWITLRCGQFNDCAVSIVSGKGMLLVEYAGPGSCSRLSHWHIFRGTDFAGGPNLLKGADESILSDVGLIETQIYLPTEVGEYGPASITLDHIWVRHLRIPYVLILVAIGLLIPRPFRRLCGAWIAERRRSQGLCPGCGYDVRMSPQVCPECGLAVEGAQSQVATLPAG